MIRFIAVLLVILSFCTRFYGKESEAAKRADRFIHASLRLAEFYSGYSDLIGEKGLFADAAYDEMDRAFLKTKTVMALVTNSGDYTNARDYLRDFREFGRAYSVLTFRVGLGGKTPEQYLKELDKMEKAYDDPQTARQKDEQIRADMENRRKAIRVLKKRIREYRQAESRVRPETLTAVRDRQDEIGEIFSRILRSGD